MAYSLQDEISRSLPNGHTFFKMYSIGPDDSIVETYYEGKIKKLSMDKVSTTKLFTKFPVIAIKATATYNDLYKVISEIFSLGLISGLDFNNNAPVNPGEDLKYVTLPMLESSPGYKGNIRCYVVLEGAGIDYKHQKDLTEIDYTPLFMETRFRIFLTSKIFMSTIPMFLENKLNDSFIDSIMEDLGEFVGSDGFRIYRPLLGHSKIVEMFNDGLSDNVLLRTEEGSQYVLRFYSTIGDLPVINNTDSDN